MATSDTIAQREAEFFAAQTHSDIECLRDVFSDDLRFVHTTGIVDGKESYLQGVQSGRYAHGNIYVLHRRIAVSDDAAGAVSIAVVDMVAKPVNQPETAMRIYQVLGWVRSGEQWRIRFRQATKQPL